MPVVTCGQCGAENPAGMRFCGQCAAPLKDGSPLDEAAPGERRLVTVLFADVSGFTALSEELDPEALRELMTRCFERLVPVIERHGGTVHQFAGDEIMALFGAPKAHEDDPERAVSCALGLHDALSAAPSADLARLDLHVGIASGLVFAGGVEVSGRREYSIMGDAVNLAARLCERADAGQTLVGPEVRRRADRVARFTSAGAIRLKGKHDAVTPHLVLSPSDDAAGSPAPSASAPVAERGIGSALVGRESELGELTQVLDDLLAGRGGVVVVSGEAGVGKSRLMAELRRTRQGQRVLWREGRAVSRGEAASYRPFLQILEQDMEHAQPDSDMRRCEKLLGRCRDLFGDQADQLTPYLAAVLNVSLPAELDLHLDALDGASMGHQVFGAVRRYLSAATARRPLVVVLEDVHWMDRSSVALADHILSLVNEVPLVVCLCGRAYPGAPGSGLMEAARADASGRVRGIELGPLARTESEDLLRNLVGPNVLPPRLIQTLLERAGGNPFYLEEQVRALIDLGSLVPQQGGWRLDHDPAVLAIPDTLQDVIIARIDLLEAGSRQTLRLASVIGRNFTFAVLHAVNEEGVDLERSLMRLEENQLIRRTGGAGGTEYAFKHALAQEATYESILHPDRRALHGRVARALETLYADRLPDVFSLLAYHYSRAEDWEKAQDYLFRAGNQAGRIAADAEALAHYRRALAAYGQVFGDRWDPADRAAVERRMGEALFRQGSYEQARLHLDRAVASVGHPMPSSPAALRRAVLREILVQVGHRLLPGWLWGRGRRAGDRVSAEQCAALGTIAWIETLGSPDRLTLAHLRCLNVAETAGLDDARVRGLLFVSVLCLLVPAGRLARVYAGLATRLARSTGQPLHIAEAHLATGYCHYARGQGDAALEAFGVARQASLASGNLTDWTSAAANTSLVLTEQGRMQDELLLAEEIALRARETSYSLMGAYGDAIAGMALDQLGRYAEAEACNRRGLEAMLAVGAHMDGLHVIGDLAQTLWRDGRLDEALQTLDQGERLLEAKPHLRTIWNTYFWTTAATIRLAAAERCMEAGGDAAGPDGGCRQETLERARVACREARACVRPYRAAAVPAYRAQGTYEWLNGRRRAARKWWRRSLRAGGRLGYDYEVARTHLEIGARTGSRAHLETAASLLAAMGADHDARLAVESLPPECP